MENTKEKWESKDKPTQQPHPENSIPAGGATEAAAKSKANKAKQGRKAKTNSQHK